VAPERRVGHSVAVNDAPLPTKLGTTLRRLAAALVLHDGFQPDEAVRSAADLVAAGIVTPATKALADRPADAAPHNRGEIVALFTEVLAEVGTPLPAVPEAGWARARWIAEEMQAHAIEPGPGAFHLWRLWQDCGTPDDELTWMLQAHDAWQTAQAEGKALIEQEILAYVPNVIAAAERNAAG